jgi:hypothetical protein
MKMKRTFGTVMFLTSIVMLYSCAANVSFVYKKSVPDLKADLYEEPQVCIALMSKDITDVKDSLINDLKQFVGKTVYINDITNELVLSEDRKAIIDHSGIALKYPQVQYLIVFYQNDPQISHHFFKRSDTEQHTNKDGSTDTTYTGYDILVYVTNFRAACETSLFELRNNELLAQASDTFTNAGMLEKRELFPDHTLLGMLSEISSKPKDDKQNYPTVISASASSKHKYFYTFLNNVYKNKTRDKKGAKHLSRLTGFAKSDLSR